MSYKLQTPEWKVKGMGELKGVGVPLTEISHRMGVPLTTVSYHTSGVGVVQSYAPTVGKDRLLEALKREYEDEHGNRKIPPDYNLNQGSARVTRFSKTGCSGADSRPSGH